MDGVMDSKDMSLSKLWETVVTKEPGVLRSMDRSDPTTLLYIYVELLP